MNSSNQNRTNRMGGYARTTLVRLLAAYLAVQVGYASSARANDCSINNENETVEVDNDGVTIRVYYDEGNCGTIGKWPQSYADAMRDVTSAALTAYWDLGFPDPFQNNFPEYKVVADPTDLGNAHAPGSCTTYGTDMTNNDKTPCVKDDDFMKMVSQHEMFHHIQKRFGCEVSDDCGGGWGAWVTEGTARYMQDKMFSDLDGSNYSFAGFMDEINGTMNIPETSLMDLSYKACLFWNYCGEQLGIVNSEPELGYDFVLSFFENVAAGGEIGQNAALEALDETIGAMGGGSLNEIWRDYAIANYAKDYDLGLLSNANLFQYIDENQNGEGNWDSIDTISAAMPSNLSSSVNAYAIDYYETDFNISTCTGVGFRGVADDDVAWAVMGINGSDRIVGITRGIGKKFGGTFITSPNQQIVRLTAVVAGLQQGTDYEIWFDSGTLELDLVRPDLTHPAYVQINDTYRPFLIKVIVDGPEGLKPEGADDKSVMGLRAEDFSITVGILDAPVISAAYVGQFYWLVAVASETLAEGVYDLTVKICDGDFGQETNVAAVIVADLTFNHVLVLDKSGSMGDPSGNAKLDAARIAASLYTDSVSESDRIGLVVFDGNEVDCDDDASVLEGIALATPSQKSDILFDLALVSAGGWTSIGDGLWKAQDQLDLFVDVADAHFAILLSDGKENEARRWNLNDGCDSAASRLLGEDTQVHTIAFGPQADAPLMQEIAADTGGEYTYVDVEASGLRGASGMSMPNELADAYLYSLQRVRNLERLVFITGDVLPDSEVEIKIGEDGIGEALFFFNVGDLAANLAVTLLDPDGIPVGAAVATEFSTATHSVFHFHVPPAQGIWTAQMSTDVETDFIAGVLGRSPNAAKMLVDVSGIPQGGAEDERARCDFEQGVPVTILAFLHDKHGPILGLRVDAEIERPDGGLSCSNYSLRDDGTQNDGQPNDGLYGLVYTETALAGTGGAINDDPNQQPEFALRGTYKVRIHASGDSNSFEFFHRFDTVAFEVCPVEDFDLDGLPDSWEKYYGTNPFDPDQLGDADNDLVNNRDEFFLGTDPFDPDTDGDGEMDGSEVLHGRCPTKPDVLAIATPIDVEFVLELGDARDPLPGTGNLLRFPWRSTYAEIVIERAEGIVPGPFIVLDSAKPTEESPIPVSFLDEAVTPYTMYHYRFRAVGVDGGLSTLSRVVSGVFIPDCNQNGVDDAHDIANGTSDDDDGNGIPDECEEVLCEGDANGDGVVDPLDSGYVLARFGCPVGTGDPSCDAADQNGDGAVDPLDSGYVLARFGECP